MSHKRLLREDRVTPPHKSRGEAREGLRVHLAKNSIDGKIASVEHGTKLCAFDQASDRVLELCARGIRRIGVLMDRRGRPERDTSGDSRRAATPGLHNGFPHRSVHARARRHVHRPRVVVVGLSCLAIVFALSRASIFPATNQQVHNRQRGSAANESQLPRGKHKWRAACTQSSGQLQMARGRHTVQDSPREE